MLSMKHGPVEPKTMLDSYDLDPHSMRGIESTQCGDESGS